jgi:hypothetical protein
MLDNLYCTHNVDIKLNYYTKAATGKCMKRECCNCGQKLQQAQDEYMRNVQSAQI